MAKGEQVDIQVEYEWVPPRCTHCVCFGHVNAQCPAIRIWREKATSQQDMEVVCEVPPSHDPSTSMDIENPPVLDQILPSTHCTTDEISYLTKKGKEKRAEIHFERYGVHSDFIDDSDANAGDMEDSEVEEEILMEGEPDQPPTPIAVTNPEWTVDMDKALKRGEERIARNKEKSMKNILGLKKPLKEVKKGKEKELKKGKEKLLPKPR